METGEFLQNAQDVGDIVVGVSQGRPVYLREVARVEAGAMLPQNYVWFTPGAAADPDQAAQTGQRYPAVTITVTKKPGENAVDVARGAAERLRATERETFLREEWPEIRSRMQRLWLDTANLAALGGREVALNLTRQDTLLGIVSTS